ncbi:MAG: serine/threonine protein phosphatase [Deltaproteobacteria bacterium RIFOXYB12_FULL_58_9]|nr:MAG: serine/threonine protein phosphatase [Deltaproteobacteria bacterium RIFOXYB12_FULL_58_9]
MRIRYAGSTHVGMKRSHNEDNFFLLAEENLYIVADGMGGHASGEVASQIAVETLANFFIDTSRDKEITWPFKEDRSLSYDENRLVTGVKLANRRVFETAQSDQRYHGMGTTLVSLVCGQSGAYMSHVGDSRGYLLRGDKIEQLSEDHSLLNDYLKVHKLTADEIEHFPHKNVIVRALGMKEVVVVDVFRLDPKPNDIYLLCSDGLSGMVTDPEICRVVKEGGKDLEKACQSLIATANANGGADNITVVLVEFTE